MPSGSLSQRKDSLLEILGVLRQVPGVVSQISTCLKQVASSTSQKEKLFLRMFTRCWGSISTCDASRCVPVIEKAFYNYRVNLESLTHVYRPDRLERIREFYEASIRLANECGYPAALKERLSAPYLSFTIAALKELAKSNESEENKREFVLGLVNDSLFIGVTDKVFRYRHFGWKRRVLLRLVQAQRVDLVLLLCSRA